jgi:glutaredoxin
LVLESNKSLEIESVTRSDMIIVYTLPVCPNCDDLKRKLAEKCIEFETRDLEDDDTRLGLLMKCVTLVEAPIVEIDGTFYDKNAALQELGLCYE